MCEVRNMEHQTKGLSSGFSCPGRQVQCTRTCYKSYTFPASAPHKRYMVFVGYIYYHAEKYTVLT